MALSGNTQAMFQGFQTGMDASLRMQQLRSQRAAQQLQERQMAQELAFKLEAHDRMVQEQAETAKAAARFDALTAESIPMTIPRPGIVPTFEQVQVPNPQRMLPEEAWMQTIGKVQAQFHPEKSMGMLADYSLIKQRREQATQRQATDQSLIEQRKASADLNRARIADIKAGGSFAPTVTQKNLRALAEAETAGEQNAISALRKQLKLDGLSDTDMVKFRSELRAIDNDLLTPVEEKQKLKEDVYQRYDRQTAQPAPNTEPNKRIRVKRPDGRTGTVPASELKHLPSDWEILDEE